MPNRYVRESAIKSRAVNALSWHGEVFYRRLINLVDDHGRYYADADILRADVFPLQLDLVREADIPRLLAECEKSGLLYRFEADSKWYLVMNTWEVGRAETSMFPEPPTNICKQMKTYVCNRKRMKTDSPDSDSDSDSDSDNYPPWMFDREFVEVWEEWKNHRKEIRHKLTKSTARKQRNWLIKLGKSKAIESISNSITHGWTGLFEPTGKPPQQQQGFSYMPDAA